jgi:hypothetical protein
MLGTKKIDMMDRMLMILAVLSFFAPPIHAEEQEVTIAALQAQLAQLAHRLEALESKQSELISTGIAPSPIKVTKRDPVLSGIKVKGDFRFRQESFEIDNRADRHRSRLRSRITMTAPVSEQVSIGFGLASGSSDPTSTNQSLGSVASSKGINLDLAYVKWQGAESGITVHAGKFKNPLQRVGGTGLIWDGDLRPEGVTAHFKRGSLFATGMGSWIDENKNETDLILLGGQIGSSFKLDNQIGVLMGLGYYNITGGEGAESLFGNSANENRLDSNGGYLNGFQSVEAFAELGFPMDKGKAILFANYVQNIEADDFDTGYSLGARVSANKWKFGWEYRELEADAVFATFADSDFIGGGTDGEGHILTTGYALSKKVSLNASLFLNDRNIDFGQEEAFKRLMLDLSVKH